MVSTLFYLRKSKINNKTGEAPIYLRITIKGKRQDLTTKRWILPQKWDSKGQKAKGNKEESNTLNSFLNSMEQDVYKNYNSLKLDEKAQTPQNIINKLKGITEKKHTLIEAYEFHNLDFKKRISLGKCSESRLEKHEITLNRLISFMKSKNKMNDIELNKLDINFISDFDFYLRTTHKNKHNTAVGYTKALKTIVNMAHSKRWIDHNPFKDWKEGFKDTNRPYLTADELKSIEDKIFALPRLELVKDIFIFACYTGLAFVDVCNLTNGKIIFGMDGKLWLSLNREKTETPTNFLILKPALNIINKYKNHPICEKTGKLFPMYAHQTTNSYLKEIATLSEINKDITFHTARHTFATTIALANNVPIETVSKILGHKDLRTTMIYAKIGNEKIQNDMENLDTILEKRKNNPQKSWLAIDL